MEEADARSWVRDRYDVPRETMERLDCFASFLAEENERQNLVSRGSLGTLWARHFADSAQLLSFAPTPLASWVDLGTGAGFPGLVIAVLHRGPVTLVEERKMRVEFLRRAAQLLGVAPDIVAGKAERIRGRSFDVISARAFAPLDKLLTIGTAFSTAKTRWILPKGRNAQLELEAAESSWQGVFRIEPSATDAGAGIIIAENVRPRGRRSPQ